MNEQDSHRQHKEFADELTGLAKEQAKANSEARLAELKKLLKNSAGNLGKFVEMIRRGKPIILQRMTIAAGKSVNRARRLGKEFGEKKIV